MALSMSVVILIPFVFTLLVLLLVKAPKVGITLIGAIVLTVAGLFGAKLLAHQGGVHIGLPGAMEWLILVAFVFVLLILTVVKAPKAGAVLIGVIVFLVLAGLVILIPVASHNQRTERGMLHDRSVERVPQILPEGVSYEPVDDSGYGLMIVKQETLPSTDRASSEPAAIWSEGVEDEYEADIYPSDLAGARALGRRMTEPIRKVVGDPNGDATIDVILFQEGNDRDLVVELGRAIEKEIPGVQYSLEADRRTVGPGEVGLTLRLDRKVPTVEYVVPGDEGPQTMTLPLLDSVESGRIVATAFNEDRSASAEVNFVAKPWVEGFAGFANERPNNQFLVARSWETCTSENEAKEQAIQDACAKLQAIVAKTVPVLPGQKALTLDWAQLQQEGFIVDQFVQSFGGMAGRLWRHAMLIDISAEKLKRLSSHMAAQVRVERITWAGMILSAIGVLLVIIVAYLFLNMATRGYYVWSLRVAGMVLAVAGVISILLVLR